MGTSVIINKIRGKGLVSEGIGQEPAEGKQALVLDMKEDRTDLTNYMLKKFGSDKKELLQKRLW